MALVQGDEDLLKGEDLPQEASPRLPGQVLGRPVREGAEGVSCPLRSQGEVQVEAASLSLRGVEDGEGLLVEAHQVPPQVGAIPVDLLPAGHHPVGVPHLLRPAGGGHGGADPFAVEDPALRGVEDELKGEGGRSVRGLRSRG